MTDKEYIQAQAVNHCFMFYMLKTFKAENMILDTADVKELKYIGNVLMAVLPNGEELPAIELDPEVSSRAIEEWGDKNLETYNKVVDFMNSEE